MERDAASGLATLMATAESRCCWRKIYRECAATAYQRDQERVWIYTQDRPFSGQRIYAPVRNPRYNESNYRTCVSTPRWSTHPVA